MTAIVACASQSVLYSPEMEKPSRIPVSEVFYNKKIVSIRGFKFPPGIPAKSVKSEEIKVPSEIEISKGEFTQNFSKFHGPAVIFDPKIFEQLQDPSLNTAGIISKFSDRFVKTTVKIKKKIKIYGSVDYGNNKKPALKVNTWSGSCNYKSLSTGKIVKKKNQHFRHIWMPVENSLSMEHMDGHRNKANMENGLKFNRFKSARENTPLVFLNDRKLPFSQKLAYGLGHFYNDICAAIWFTYALIFLQLVAEMGPVNAGFLLFVGQAVDAVTTPIAGYLIDRTVHRKLWHFVGSLMVLFSFPLIFTTPAAVMSSATPIQLLYFSLSISVFQVGWAVVQIAHLSLLPELTTLTEERTQLTAHRYTASMAAHILVYFVAWAFLSSSQGVNMKLIGPADSWRFVDLAVLTSLIGLVATVMFQVTLQTSSGLLPNVPRSQGLVSLRAKSLEFFKSPHLYSVAVIYTSSRLFMTLSLVYLPMFINETVLSQVGTLATVPLASFLVSAFAALIVKLCSENCGGLRATYLIGSAFCLLGCILIHFTYTKSDDTHKVFGVAILFGAGSSITMVVSLCVTANLIGFDSECGALVYSIVTFADKLLNGLAVIIIEELKCSNEEDCPYYYGGVLSYVNCGVVLCGLAVIYMLPNKLFASTSSHK